MKSLILISLIFSALAFCSSCKSPASITVQPEIANEQDAQKVLLENKWILKQVDGVAIDIKSESKNKPFIQFNYADMKVYGYGGCNGFFGEFALKSGNKIEFSKIGSTLLACENLKLESSFLGNLAKVDNFEIQNSKLVLKDKEMNSLLLFEPEVKQTMKADNSQNSLDWNGVYVGVIPCADCEGIETSLELYSTMKYILTTKYLGKGEETYTTTGNFKWNEQGNTIILIENNKSEIAYAFFVGENTLTQLDQSGNRIDGELSEKYILKKEMNPVINKIWKLVELNGKPVQSSAQMILKADGKSLRGNGGCNTFFGNYEISEGNRLKLIVTGSTKMNCEDMNIEIQFFDVLNKVDNYSINGDQLSLQKAKMAPMARFEAVYLK